MNFLESLAQTKLKTILTSVFSFAIFITLFVIGLNTKTVGCYLAVLGAECRNYTVTESLLFGLVPAVIFAIVFYLIYSIVQYFKNK